MGFRSFVQLEKGTWVYAAAEPTTLPAPTTSVWPTCTHGAGSTSQQFSRLPKDIWQPLTGKSVLGLQIVAAPGQQQTLRDLHETGL